MSDPLEKITEGKDLIGKIRNKLADFIGYFDRENRREADKLLREEISKRYEEQWSRISSVQRQLIAGGQLKYLDDLEEAAIKMRIFSDRMRRAAYGYAGFFNAVRINSDELSKLYEYDMALLENVDNVERAIDNVEASIDTEGLPAAIRHLVKLGQEALDTFDKRVEVILTTEGQAST
jgi:hypothetical protein